MKAHRLDMTLFIVKEYVGFFGCLRPPSLIGNVGVQIQLLGRNWTDVYVISACLVCTNKMYDKCGREWSLRWVSGISRLAHPLPFVGNTSNFSCNFFLADPSAASLIQMPQLDA